MNTKVRERRVKVPIKSHERLFIGLAKELALVDPDGRLTQHATNLEALTRTLVAGMGAAEMWSEALGPVYDVDGVKSILGISKQAISKRENLLALTTGSGRVVYPAFQFVGTEVVGGMSQIRALLPKELISPWDLASWLNAPEADLDGNKPIELLRHGVVDRVLSLASSWSRNLSQ